MQNRVQRNWLLVLAVAAGLLIVAGWYAWQWYTTPSLPEIVLDRAEPALIELVETAKQDVLKEPRSAERWGRLGMILTANELPGPALICLEHAERFDPADPRWPYFRGQWYVFTKPHDAIALFRRALERAQTFPQQETILFQLARVEIEVGLLDEAQEHLDAMAALRAGTAQEQTGRALLANKRGDRPQARKYFEGLTENPSARKLACTFLAALTADQRDVADRYRQQAAALPNDMGWPDAILSEMNVYIVHRESKVRQVKGMLLMGELTKARELARELVAARPDAEATLLLADSLVAGHDYDEAARVLRSFLQREPDNLPAHIQLGQMLLQQGEELAKSAQGKAAAQALFGQAVDAADKAIAVSPIHGEAHFLRGQALEHLARRADAIAAYRKALACRPDLAKAHLTLGEALGEAGDVTKALEHLEHAVRLSLPNDPRPREALKKWQAKAGAK